jgi:hypothetical protein
MVDVVTEERASFSAMGEGTSEDWAKMSLAQSRYMLSRGKANIRREGCTLVA